MGAGRSAEIPLFSPLVPLEGQAELPFDDVGKEGGIRPVLHLQTSNFAEYICKGPSLLPDHPFIGVNEWVVGGLARALSIPVRSTELIAWKGATFFGSEVLARDRKMTGLLGANWARLENAPAIAYPVIALDSWVLNSDRHDQNFLAGVLGDGRGRYVAVDHDLGLFGIDRTRCLDYFTRLPISEPLARSGVLRNAISDWSALHEAIARVEAVEDEYIWMLVAQLPVEWIGEYERETAIRFLIERRDRLRSLFSAGRATFPNLVGEEP